MRKLFLLAIVLAASLTSADAQIVKGKVLLGATAQYHYSTSESQSSKQSSGAFEPKDGYFLSDHFLLGASVGYSFDKDRSLNNVNPGSILQTVSFSPFARYYASITERFKFFGQLAASAAAGPKKLVDGEGKIGAKIGGQRIYSCAISPGFTYFLTSKVGLDLMFQGFSFTKNNFNYSPEYAGGQEYNYTTVSAGGSSYFPYIGLQFYF